MTVTLKLATSVFLVLFLSKSCKENQQEEEGKATTQNIEHLKEDMAKKGYKLGTLLNNEAASCPNLLLVEEQYLDPINLDEFTMTIGSKVWVKYQDLRMQSRCDDGRPIRIESIKKAEI